jgi:predicted trehalose synthase
VWVDIDRDLLHAFEVDKELYEFAYAALYLPSWLYAPTEGMRALFSDGRPA